MTIDYSQLGGWNPNPEACAKYAANVGSLSQVASNLIGGEQKDTFLWLGLMQVKPNWKRGAQGLGSCVGWGAELVCTNNLALDSIISGYVFPGEVATEPIYGGARVEIANNGREDRGGDGTYGAAAAQWVNKFGVLLRQDYSPTTNSDDDDLSRYSADKEKSWGRYGCGGSDDKGRLDDVAKFTPVKTVTQGQTIEDAIGGLTNGYGLTIASMAGFGQMRRDESGVVRRSGKWAHQMCVLGIRWVNGKPQFRVFQSWGPKSVSGPDPGIEHPAISGCSWWITESDMAWILRTGDCWIFSYMDGFVPQAIDHLLAWNSIG